MNYMANCKDCCEEVEIRTVDWRPATCPNCGSMEIKSIEDAEEKTSLKIGDFNYDEIFGDIFGGA